MKLDIKKLLLAGTAIVAVGAAGATSAKAADLTLGANGTWASAGGANSTPTTDVTNAAAGDNVDITTGAVTLTVTNGGPTDGTGANAFVLGAVTDSGAGVGAIDITAGAAADLTATIGSAVIDGAFSLTGADATDADLTVGVTGALTTGTTLTVLSDGDTQQNASALTVGGALTVGTTTAVTAGAFAGSTATLNADGNTSFTGAVTLTGGADAGANAELTLSGASNTFTGGLNLATAAKSILTVDGAVAQTVTGVISGAGDINVTNTHASGVTFAGDSTHTGNLTVNNDGNNQSVTFTGDSASAIALGDNSGADTITANFTGETLAISGGITGGASETVNVNFAGGSTITLSGAATSGVDTAAISGNTTVTTNQNFGATNITVASGSTLATTANTVTGAIANSGTLQLGGGSVTGDVTGTGLLDVNTTGTVTGSITQGTADIAAVTLNQATGGTYNVGTTTFSADGTLAFDNAARTVTGNFTNATDAEGTITIADGTNTTAFVGNLGASTSNSLKALTVAGGSANVVTTTGNLYVDAITLNDADTLSFIGTSAQTVSGTITDGILNVGDGTKATDVTFSGVISSAVTQNVQAAATARYNANATFTGAYTNAGATHVGSGATLTAASLTDSGGTFVLGVADSDGTLTAADFGQISVGAAALDTDDVTISVTGVIGLADDLDIAGAATFDEAKVLVDNSALYVFTVDATHNIDVTQASTASITNNAAKKATADNLLAVTATGELLQVQNAFVSAGSADVNNVLEAAASDVSAGAVVGGVQVAGHTTSVNNQRLAALRSGDETGMSAGQMMSGLKAWIQGFGATGEQDERDNVSGYDVDSVGFALGLDTENVAEDLTVGVSVAYANTDVESDAISNAETEIDSYQIALYGDYDLSNTAFITAQLAYMWSDNETTRNPGGVSSLVANGDYDSDTFIANATLGNDYHMGHGSLVLTPSVSANYVHYSADSYTETGAGTANLSVNSDSMNIFELGLGVNAEWSFEQANGSWFKPSVGVGVRHDLIGDEYQATNQFAGSTTSFEVEGYDPAQTTFDAGVGFKYYTTDSWTISADYNYEFKSDFDSHAGVVKASYKF